MVRGGLLIASGLVLVLTGALAFYTAITYLDYHGWRSGLLHSASTALPGTPAAESATAQLNALQVVGLGLLTVGFVLGTVGSIWSRSEPGGSRKLLLADPLAWASIRRLSDRSGLQSRRGKGTSLVVIGIALLVAALALSFLLEDTLSDDLSFGLHGYIGPPPVVYALIVLAFLMIAIGLKILMPGHYRRFLRTNLPLPLLTLSLILPWWMAYEWVGGPGGQWVLWFLGSRVIYVDTPGPTATEMVVTLPAPTLYPALALVSLAIATLGYSNWTKDASRWIKVLAATMLVAALLLDFFVMDKGLWVLPGSYNGKMLYDGLGPGWFLALLGFMSLVYGMVKNEICRDSGVAD